MMIGWPGFCTFGIELFFIGRDLWLGVDFAFVSTNAKFVCFAEVPEAEVTSQGIPVEVKALTAAPEGLLFFILWILHVADG
jgi:hypothetical protein